MDPRRSGHASLPKPSQPGVTAVIRKSAAVSPLPRNTPTQGAQGELGHATLLFPSLPSLWHPVSTGCWVRNAVAMAMGVLISIIPWYPGLAQAGPCPHPLVPWLRGTWTWSQQVLHSLGHRKLPLQPRRCQAPAGTYGGGCGVGGRKRRGALRQWGGWLPHKDRGPPPLVPLHRAGAGHWCCWGGRGAQGRVVPGALGCQWGSYPQPSTPSPIQCHRSHSRR